MTVRHLSHGIARLIFFPIMLPCYIVAFGVGYVVQNTRQAYHHGRGWTK